MLRRQIGFDAAVTFGERTEGRVDIFGRRTHHRPPHFGIDRQQIGKGAIGIDGKERRARVLYLFGQRVIRPHDFERNAEGREQKR